MYEDMKSRVETAVERGFVDDEYKISAEAFEKWNQGFTTKDHPEIVQVQYKFIRFYYKLKIFM